MKLAKHSQYHGTLKTLAFVVAGFFFFMAVAAFVNGDLGVGLVLAVLGVFVAALASEMANKNRIDW